MKIMIANFFLAYLFVIVNSLCLQRFPAMQWVAEYKHHLSKFLTALYLIPQSMDTVTNLYAWVEPSISTVEFTPPTMQTPVG